VRTKCLGREQMWHWVLDTPHHKHASTRLPSHPQDPNNFCELYIVSLVMYMLISILFLTVVSDWKRLDECSSAFETLLYDDDNKKLCYIHVLIHMDDEE
jgi:hypothetical protein